MIWAAMESLASLKWQWWQILLVVIFCRLPIRALFLTIPMILISRMMKPELARIALPLIAARRNEWNRHWAILARANSHQPKAPVSLARSESPLPKRTIDRLP